MPNELRYPEYREYLAKRQATNTAMQGLLAGSKLSAHLMALTEGSTKTLGEIFPQVPRIHGFNLRSSAAKAVLDDAEHHLGLMAVPYLLAIHEDFGKGCLRILARAGKMQASAAESATSATVHRVFAQRSRRALSSDWVGAFDLLRMMRNSVIHRGGRADDKLARRSAATSRATSALWVKMTTHPSPRFANGDPVPLGFSEMVATLAVTKQLAREMNTILGSVCPRSMWLDLLVDDFEGHTDISPKPDKRMRLARGISGFDYRPLQFTDAELRAALKQRGWL